ncbi:MAG: hypothetical protein ACOC5B_01650 [Myxococcota bacterium]
MSLSAAPNGAVIVADGGSNTLSRISEDGEIVWRTGGTGQGPGEFQKLYRVSVSEDGTIVAYDLVSRQLSWFEPTGNFVRRSDVRLSITPLSDIVLLSDRSLLLAGVVYGIPYSIHRVDEQGKRLASFGPRPEVRNRRTLRYWGVGGIEITSDNTVLFSVKIPYRIYEFFLDGRLRSSWAGSHEFERAPDDAFDIAEGFGQVTVSISREFTPFPGAAHDLGDGYVLGQVRTQRDVTVWDIFRSERHVARCERPSLGAVVAVDRGKRYLYVSGRTVNENKAYFRIRYTLVGAE